MCLCVLDVVCVACIKRALRPLLYERQCAPEAFANAYRFFFFYLLIGIDFVRAHASFESSGGDDGSQ